MKTRPPRSASSHILETNDYGEIYAKLPIYHFWSVSSNFFCNWNLRLSFYPNFDDYILGGRKMGALLLRCQLVPLICQVGYLWGYGAIYAVGIVRLGLL